MNDCCNELGFDVFGLIEARILSIGPELDNFDRLAGFVESYITHARLIDQSTIRAKAVWLARRNP